MTNLSRPPPPLWRWLSALLALLAALGSPLAAADPAAATRAFDLPAGEAARTLPLFAEQSGRGLVLGSETARGVRTPALRGAFAPAEALNRLLAGTDLAASEDTTTGAFAISRRPTGGSVPAAPAVTGTLVGRVLNPDNGEFVENARVTVEGTTLATLTDATGTFRLTRVPAGNVRVTAFRTGAVPLTHAVTVDGGAVVTRDFSLPARGEVVRLAAFTVGTSQEMTGAAIAINTQRFAPNVMNVLAADEFGPVASGNVGELLRAVPGVSIELGGLGAPYTISLNGVPPGYVPVTIGGFSIADSAQGTGRAAGVHQLSINNMSRIEVIYTPTPDTSGSALAGSVNFVPRSALERSRPSYTVTTSLLMRDRERSFEKTGGPRRAGSRKITPELNIAAIVPLSAKFGFTFSASTFETYAPNDFMQRSWRGAGTVTNGAAFPDTTPGRPYLTEFAIRDRVAFIRRSTAAGTLDFKLSPYDRVSLSLQHGAFRSPMEGQTLTFVVNRVQAANFGPTFTRSDVGQGEIRLNNQGNNQDDQFWMPGLNYWHHGPVWNIEAGAGSSNSLRWTTDIPNSHWGTSLARRQGVTVAFDDITALGPRRLAVTDGATGAPVDPYAIGSYGIVNAGANTARRHAVQDKLFAHASRDLLGLRLRGGLDVNRAMRDARVYNPTFTFVGADGRAGTADDAAAPFLNLEMSRRSGVFGYPRMDRVSTDLLHDRYRSAPEQFQANAATVHTSGVALSKHAEETITAAYLRADAQLLGGRLKLVGGLRAEQTNVKGQGALIDSTRNYRRDAAGRPIRDAAGRPTLQAPAGSLEAVRLTNVDRGLRAEKEYLRWFPSLNASYSVRENLIARAGYYWSVGRPDFVQYAGSLTLPDVDQPPSPANRITVNNAGIKAWSAQTWKATIEHYFADVGLLSVAGFYREIENFFGATVFNPTAEFLALYGLDPAVYGPFDASTQYNLPGKVRMTGVDVNYKHALTFLPAWARGLQVFANASAQRATGEAADNFSGYVPRSANWGVSVTRGKVALRARWNYTGESRRGRVAAGRGIEAGTYNWRTERLLFDVSGDYALSRRFTLFFNLSNLTDDPVINEIAGPSTPDHARNQQYQLWGSLWTVGLKGTF